MAHVKVHIIAINGLFLGQCRFFALVLIMERIMGLREDPSSVSISVNNLVTAVRFGAHIERPMPSVLLQKPIYGRTESLLLYSKKISDSI